MATRSDWVVSCGGPIAPAARIFCFPHAGGSNVAFSGWRGRLPPDLEIVSFCYPGRLRLIREEPLTDLHAIVSGLRAAIVALLDVPGVFLGHSLGALIAFELARDLRRHGGPRPAALIVSAHPAPQLPRRTPDLHHLPERELVRELEALDGLPAGVAKQDEWLALVLPAVRADLRMHETYVFRDEAPLDCPIHGICGCSDPQVSPAEMADWRHQTRGAFSLGTFPGGHFFLFSAQDEVLTDIDVKLRHWLTSAGRFPRGVVIGD